MLTLLRLTTPLFLLFAFIYVASISQLPYDLDFLLKVLPIVVLLVAVIISARGNIRLFLSTAIVMSGIGDVMLALSIENAFLFGLGAFLVAQIVYAVTLFKLSRISDIKFTQKISIAVMLVYAVIMAMYLLPHTGGMLIPVSVYLLVITAMGIAALLSNLNRWAIIGAISFIASDSLLAISLFREPLPYSSFLVMITYYLAQYNLYRGLVKQSL
jgi:uncharacterized membrane protein YhhN